MNTAEEFSWLSGGWECVSS